ncbi:25S rRNA (uracil2634-N3)-methyltransferase [Sarracenia purpurea var. burkii]
MSRTSPLHRPRVAVGTVVNLRSLFQYRRFVATQTVLHDRCNKNTTIFVASVALAICICGEPLEEDELETPDEASSPLLPPATPVLPSDPSTNTELLQTLVSSSPNSSVSCNEWITSCVSNPLPTANLVEETSPSEPLLQNLRISPHSELDSQEDSCTESALQKELLLIPSSNSESSSHDLNSSSSPWLEYLFINSSTYGSLGPDVVADSSIDVMEEKKQVVCEVLKLKDPKEREGKIAEQKVSKIAIKNKKKVSKVVINEIWMKHYSSCQKILLVGEGDFSFSASLAVAFGSAHNMIATSLNSQGFLSSNYKSAMSNIQILRSRGAKVMHDVDATQMANSFLFQGMTFDRIVFNFPHAGFISGELRESQLRRHRKLVQLFMANAKKMIDAGNGEIHITHKSNAFFREWNLEQLASSEGLIVLEKVDFNVTDFLGYHTKYGYGGDKNFNCKPSKTYKFGLKIY